MTSIKSEVIRVISFYQVTSMKSEVTSQVCGDYTRRSRIQTCINGNKVHGVVIPLEMKTL